MPHDHSHKGHTHTHTHIDPEAGDARVVWAIAVNMFLTLAQVVGGIFSGSLALIADALHNFSDAIALVIAFFARKIARRPADPRMSFGYGRAEVVAALVNYTTLIVLSVYLFYEGVMRFFEPEPINGWIVIWIAALALIVDLITAALTYTMAKESMNIRAAFLHNVADALGSIAVIVAGSAVILFNWTWVDPTVTIMISVYILWHVKSEIGETIRVLMLAAPPGLDPEEVASTIESMPGVADVHHVHLWSMQEREFALTAHLVIAAPAWSEAEGVRSGVRQALSDQFGIRHATLEIEQEDRACVGSSRFGHGEG
ncbi:cation diffusion facilitator family transporter [Ruegeria sp. Ofav3-42]|uniref:cation diffusion facilitator family transporter n=1 Tax=Ruegeria sp. Ofav3-42 TaxID=2917759 RepID=UPI001EF3F6A5|nr:cation diffusion facilitator family transporter [Ruegeria sp. Ofav3-42]MCG7519645.1 cation diffusion facilitator family transporter [Ruegeria sp. Ofav3-42]